MKERERERVKERERGREGEVRKGKKMRPNHLGVSENGSRRRGSDCCVRKVGMTCLTTC